MREWLQTVTRSFNPTHYIGLLCRCAPDTRDIDFIPWLPQSERRVTHAYTADSAAQGYENQLARCGRRVDSGCNFRNGGGAKLAKKEVRLKMSDRRLQKSTCALSVQIGHDSDAVTLWFKRTQRPDHVVP